MKAATSRSISLVAILFATGTSAQVLVSLAAHYRCVAKCMTIQFDDGTISHRALALPPPRPRHYR